MRIFLVERYLPGIQRPELEQLAERLEAASVHLRAEAVQVRYLGSLFLPEEESCFCRVEAVSAEAVVQLNELAAAPYARVSPTVPLGPSAGQQSIEAVASSGQLACSPPGPPGEPAR